MFTELRIRNFRLFEDLTIKGLRRINLFVGRNNSGKSAAVEAVALVAGGHSAEVPFRLNLERGMKVHTNEYAFDGYLQSFFRDLDASKGLEITARNSKLGVRKVTATLEQAPAAWVLADRAITESISETPTQTALAIHVVEEDGRRLRYRTFLRDESVEVSNLDGSLQPPHPYWVEYVPTNLELGELVFSRLSELRREKNEGRIVGVLRQIEPRLVDAPEVLIDHGVPNLFCDIGIGKLLPIGLMGQGLARVFRLVLMMQRGSSTEGSIIVIDEIENGIHHESMSDVWRAIGEAAHRYDKQVFATTHSYECLRSANDAIDSNDLAIHRLEVDGDRTTRCVTLGPEAVEGAISNGFEIR